MYRGADAVWAVAAIMSVALTGCADREERADVGYDDGYAVGYNTACQILKTLVEGDFIGGLPVFSYGRWRLPQLGLS